MHCFIKEGSLQSQPSVGQGSRVLVVHWDVGCKSAWQGSHQRPCHLDCGPSCNDATHREHGSPVPGLRGSRVFINPREML